MCALSHDKACFSTGKMNFLMLRKEKSFLQCKTPLTFQLWKLGGYGQQNQAYWCFSKDASSAKCQRWHPKMNGCQNKSCLLCWAKLEVVQTIVDPPNGQMHFEHLQFHSKTFRMSVSRLGFAAMLTIESGSQPANPRKFCTVDFLNHCGKVVRSR